MRRARYFSLFAAGITVIAALSACGGSSTSSSGGDAIAHGSARRGAGPATREVCDEMVRDSVPSTVGMPLVGEPVSAVRGDTFTCRYAFDGGTLDLSVRDMHTLRQAREYFREIKRGEAVKDVLPGLAEGGFTKADGSVVAKKDAMILTVDVTALPPTRVDPSGVGIDVAATVLGCW